MTASPRFVSVALPIPLRRLFTYTVDAELGRRLSVGCRVRVPLGPRRAVGTVVEWPAEPPAESVRLRAVSGILEDQPCLAADLLELTRFVADYYLCSWGDAIEAALPPAGSRPRSRRMVRRLPAAQVSQLPARAVARRRLLEALPEDGTPVPLARLGRGAGRVARELAKSDWVALEDRPEDEAPAAAAPAAPDPAPPPTPAQAAVLEQLSPALRERRFASFLLYGATGSGKTEVYLRAAAATLERGGSVLYLVPEIGLTPMLLRLLRRRFPGEVGVLHSALPARQRLGAWRRIQRGECRFAVGTRSAVFAPLNDLGLVVVDEEQDASYKQQDTPRYNGRDLAVVRARQSGATLLLGSATPSLESFQHATAGRYRLLRLGGRVEDRPLPEVHVVDMRREFQECGEIRPLSRALVTEIAACLERGEQALVLRNRRGWAVALFCPSCGDKLQCQRCSVSLTWHRADRRLRCHYCGFETRRPEQCARCGAEELRLLGEGTERIEDDLKAALPLARIERMDRDTVRRRGAHERLLRRFAEREIDVLVGTQMIAKGHDFPNVTLVGVLSADQSLGLPDFRAAERTFQLLTQVAGRAGRGSRPGRVVVQAFDPGHPVLREAAVQDYEAFFNREIRYRRALRYPPFTGLVELLTLDADAHRAAEWAELLARALREAAGGRLLLAGPGPAPIERIRGTYRQQVLVRSAGRRRLVQTVGRVLVNIEGLVPARHIQVDVDPLSLM